MADGWINLDELDESKLAYKTIRELIRLGETADCAKIDKIIWIIVKKMREMDNGKKDDKPDP